MGLVVGGRGGNEFVVEGEDGAVKGVVREEFVKGVLGKEGEGVHVEKETMKILSREEMVGKRINGDQMVTIERTCVVQVKQNHVS